MSNTNQNQAATAAPTLTPDQIAAAKVLTASRKALLELQRSYFPSERLEAAQEALGKINELCVTCGVPMVFSFNPEDGIEEGFGIAVVPVNKRKKGGAGNETIGVAVGLIPEMSLIEAHENGASYIQDTITDSLITKFANTVRPRGDDTQIESFGLPVSVADFIISQRAGGMLGGFNELANDFVMALKKKGISFLTKATLRQVLSCSAFAEQHYPQLPQTAWVAVLNQMKNLAVKADLETGIFDQWIETRDNAELPTVDADLSDLNISFGDDDAVDDAPAGDAVVNAGGDGQKAS